MHKSRQWTSADTREALLESAWLSLQQGGLAETVPILNIDEVLDSAPNVWEELFPDYPKRAFTRGAINAHFENVQDYATQAILHGLKTRPRRRSRHLMWLQAAINLAGDQPSARRGEPIRRALQAFVEQEVASLARESHALLGYLAVLSRSDAKDLVNPISSAYRDYDRGLVEICQHAVLLAGWPIDPEDLAHTMSALIDGAAIRIATDRRTKTSFAQTVALAALTLPEALAQTGGVSRTRQATKADRARARRKLRNLEWDEMQPLQRGRQIG